MCGFMVSSGSCDEELFMTSLGRLTTRGPDNTTIEKLDDGSIVGFHRLAIMDTRPEGNQPFTSASTKTTLLCNGEIFNQKELRTDYVSTYPFHSTSDCEVLLPLFEEYGLRFLCEQVDAEFAMAIYDHNKGSWQAARDPIGIRPLFYGYNKELGHILFASEAKALIDLCENVEPFPPGHYYQDGEFHCYLKPDWKKPIYKKETEHEIYQSIQDLLISAVEKRLQADVPVGFLLSGGLDSSLVCSIAAKLTDQPITTFAVGFEEDPIDTKYARQVAEYIGSDHHEVIFTKKQVEETLPQLIYQLETFDITTIRAAMGMYLLCEYIKKETNIKVVLTGEVSDELFGYKYTDFAPSAFEFQKEAALRVEELYMYDVLRADRCISAHSLEARVPFADKNFVEYVMAIDPDLKMNTTGIGKYLLRRAFEGTGLLPQSILYRDKAAFSDAVGHGMVDHLKLWAQNKYSQAQLKVAQDQFPHSPPISMEALMYREIFESHFPDCAHLIKGFWMPNPTWKNCQVNDPSARALPNYGKSGE